MALKIPKFKYGDRVVINTNGTDKPGRITSVFKDRHGAIVCRVKFDSPSVQPNEMEFPESFLKPIKRRHRLFGNWIDVEKKCPKCGTDWHVTESPIFGKKEIWYDCTDCNQTREEIEEEINNEPQEYWD